MKKLVLCTLFQIFLIAPAMALLPPLYESLSEFQSVINSKELASKLDAGETLVNVTRKENSFLVETNKHSLHVDIVYDPSGHPGPAKYHLVFKEAEPLH